MADFEDFMKAILEGIKEIAGKNLKEFKEEALKDGEDFLELTKDDLKRWTKLLAKGDLTKDDYEFLVLGRKDAMEMLLLKRKGLSLIRIERFRNKLVDLIIDKAFDLF